MKNIIQEDKAEEFKIEINGTRVRVKGSNFYKKMMSRNTSSNLATELKEQGLVEGLNPVTVDRFMELLEAVTSNRDASYKAIKKAIKKGDTLIEGIRTTSKERASILRKLRKKEVLDETKSISKKGRTIEIVDVSVQEEEEDADW